jgi:hypothetical protein
MSETRIIKKYPNRRLYDTAISSYITLNDVRKLVTEGVSFQVVDVRSKEDITRSILQPRGVHRAATGDDQADAEPDRWRSGVDDDRHNQAQLRNVVEHAAGTPAAGTPEGRSTAQAGRQGRLTLPGARIVVRHRVDNSPT